MNDPYWDAEDGEEVIEPTRVISTANRCKCDKQKHRCQRAFDGEDKLCETCRDGCVSLNRPGNTPIHTRGLSRGRRSVAERHAADLQNTLDALAAEHEKDAELGGEMTARPSGGMQRTLGDIRSLPTYRGDD